MSIIGIDIGTSGCIVSTIQKGAVTIIRNDLSERITPSLVSFTQNERLIGESAKTQISSLFKTTCRNMKLVLGCTSDDANAVNYEKTYSLAPLTFLNEGSTNMAGYGIQFDDKVTEISVTRCMAALLTKLKQLAVKSIGHEVKDTVIAVPAYFSDRARQAMIDAAFIAGLNCLNVINEHAAVALDYGIYRSSTFSAEKPVRVVFVGVGHSTSTISVVDYTSKELKVIAFESDKNLGGRDFTYLLMRHFADKFYAKHKLNPMESTKIRLKLEEASESVKKILSANTEALFQIECLMDDYDIVENITRDTFENISEPLLHKLHNLLDSTFSKSNINPSDVNSIELFGNGTRIPCIQNVILNFFNKRLPISKTLSMDEAVARGCVLQAAMLNPCYRVREFNLIDIIPYNIGVSWVVPASNESGYESKTSILFEKGSCLGNSKVLTFQRNTHFDFIILYPDSTENFKVTLIVPPEIETVPAEFQKGIKVKIHLMLSGIVSIEEAQILIEEPYDEVIKEKRLKEKKENVKSESPSPPQPESVEPNEDNNQSEKTNNKPVEDEYEEVQVVKKSIKHKRYNCKIECSIKPGYLTHVERIRFQHSEKDMIQKDKLAQEIKEMLNELETYVYHVRAKISEEWKSFTTKQETSIIDNCLNETVMWVYDNGNAPKNESSQKLEELKKLVHPIVTRFNEYQLRSNIISESLEQINSFKQIIASNEFNHIPIDSIENLKQNVLRFENYIDDVIKKCEHMALSADPIIKFTDIEAEKQSIHNLVKSVLVPKPVVNVEPATATPLNVENPTSELFETENEGFSNSTQNPAESDEKMECPI